VDSDAGEFADAGGIYPHYSAAHAKRRTRVLRAFSELNCT
jgi:hypothetical protein